MTYYLLEFLSNRRLKVVAKVLLKLNLLSARKIEDSRVLTLSLRNVGRSILKNMVVELHSPQSTFLTDCKACFVYALMPNANQNITFRAFLSSLQGAYFSVSGYVRGDQFFSIRSPTISDRNRHTVEKEILLC